MTVEWNKVTWYSKIAAVIVFGGVFVLGYWLGAQNAEVVYVEMLHIAHSHDAKSESFRTNPLEISTITNSPDTYNGQAMLVRGQLDCDSVEQYFSVADFLPLYHPQLTHRQISRVVLC